MSTIQPRRPEKKEKKLCNVDPKILIKILITYPPTFPFFKSFPKNSFHRRRQGKESERRGEERKWKEKFKTAVWLFNPKTLLSVNAQTQKANILHLHQKTTKCLTCKRLSQTVTRKWLNYRKSSIKPPLSNKPAPSNKPPPLFRGGKLISSPLYYPPPPTPILILRGLISYGLFINITEEHEAESTFLKNKNFVTGDAFS